MKILQLLTPRRIIGNLGEKAAAKFLKKHHYRILERNYVAENGEIDIIAKTKDTIVFVEVKTRNIKSLGSKEARPASSVTPEKQRKIIKTASRFLGHKYTDLKKRFDVIEVYLDSSDGKTKIKEIRHLENTFDLNTAYKRTAY